MLAFTLATLVVMAPAQAAPGKPICQNDKVRPIDKPSGPARARPLAEEPNARRVLTVVRTLDGCQTPVYVSGEIGSRPHRR
jgi:hypothetical protein